MCTQNIFDINRFHENCIEININLNKIVLCQVFQIGTKKGGCNAGEAGVG